MSRSGCLIGALTLHVLATLVACPAPTPSSRRIEHATNAGEATTSEVEVQRTDSGALVRIKPSRATERPQLIAGATLRRRRKRPSTVLFGITASGKQWRYQGCRKLALEIDGGPPMSVPAERESQIGHGQLTEIVIALVPLGTVERLARASAAVVAICGERLALDGADLALLRRFLDRLRTEIESE